MFQPQSAFNSFWICVDVCPPCVFVYINESVCFVPCSCHKGMFDVFRKRWSFPLTYQVVGTMRSKPLNTIDFIIRVCVCVRVCFRAQFAKATELASLRVWVRNERNHSGMRALHIWASHSALFVGNDTFCFRNHLSLRLPLAKQTNFRRARSVKQFSQNILPMWKTENIYPIYPVSASSHLGISPYARGAPCAASTKPWNPS